MAVESTAKNVNNLISERNEVVLRGAMTEIEHIIAAYKDEIQILSDKHASLKRKLDKVD